MKQAHILFLLAGTFVLASCSTKTSEQAANENNGIDTSYAFYGDTVSFLSSAVGVETFETLMQENGKLEESMLTATVAEVCQAKGCWINIALSSGDMMKVKFKDYAFFVPKDIAGKEIVIKGMATTDTTSVEELRHYAEDAGKSQAEIDSITEPQIGYRFLASGVAIKK